MYDDPFLRIEGQTFADDSFRIGDPAGIVVVADVAIWTEASWQRELVRIIGPDRKWSRLEARWRDLSLALRRSILRDLRDALISIVDPSIYRLDLERSIERSLKKPRRQWSPEYATFITELLNRYERQQILWDSPASRIQDYLEDDGVYLGWPGGIEGNLDPDRSFVSEIGGTLTSPESVRFFGARAATAFSILLDREARQSVLKELEQRFVTRDQIVGYLLAKGERIERVFDEGNRPSIKGLLTLKGAVRDRLEARQLIIRPDDVSPGVIEKSSAATPPLQISDFAAGYARGIYVTLGLKAVCEEFRAVILNGSMVRDWQQVDRNDGNLRRKA